jgi:hypothetical protein
MPSFVLVKKGESTTARVSNVFLEVSRSGRIERLAQIAQECALNIVNGKNGAEYHHVCPKPSPAVFLFAVPSSEWWRSYYNLGGDSNTGSIVRTPDRLIGEGVIVPFPKR